MTYREMKAKHEREVNAFLNNYCFFAFSDEQFQEGLKKFSIPENEAGTRLYGLGGTGGYILREKSPDFGELMRTHSEERAAAVADPATGEDFAFQMFYDELNNHEYVVTGATGETLEALGYSEDEILNNPTLWNALKRAAQTIRERGDE